MRMMLQAALAATLLALATAAPAQAQDDPTAFMVSYIEVAPASKANAVTLLRQLRDASRKEDGAIRFEVLQRTAPSNQFVILEIWKDEAALNAHAAAAPSKQFREKLAPLLIAPVDDRLCVTTTVDPLQAARGRPGANTVYLVTHVDVGPPNRDKTVVALKAFAEATRKEAGNLRFDVVHQKARTNHFTVIEAWKDQKADDAHEHAAHTREFRGVLTPLTGALYDQRWYKAL
jgi:quinol monooxygenase YgiN